MYVTATASASMDSSGAAERGGAKPSSPENSVPTGQTDPDRRHSLSMRRASGGGGAPGLRKSRSTQSMILRRTGSTATTSRPYDWRPIRSYVGFTGGEGGGKLPLSRSGKSLTSVRTRQTIISRKDYHEDLKPTIVAVSVQTSSVCAISVTEHVSGT